MGNESVIDICKKQIVEMLDDPNHRFWSWDHCNSYFMNQRTRKAPDIERSALQLSAYLASWGMYRGNGFLLYKDYKLLCPVVEVVYDSAYNDLWHADPFSAKQPAWAATVFTAAGAIRNAFGKTVSFYKEGMKLTRNTTDTLVTKVMLSTFACTPAYDRYLIDALKAESVSSSFSKKGFDALLEYAGRKQLGIASIQRMLAAEGCKHPPMKILDMYLWAVGEAR